MANTKYILEQIKIEGVMAGLIAKSNGENVNVTYNGKDMTLSAALTAIYTGISGLPTTEAVSTAISAAIDNLIGGAPDTYDTLKEIADYIEAHKDVSDALTAAIGGKVDKVEGKGLSAEDFTTALKTKLENMEPVTAAEKATWNAKAEKTEATTTTAGLMSAADKTRLDGLRGVRYGKDVPADMQNGELFIRVVSE